MLSFCETIRILAVCCCDSIVAATKRSRDSRFGAAHVRSCLTNVFIFGPLELVSGAQRTFDPFIAAVEASLE